MFQDEIKILRQKLKEAEMGAEQDRFLRTKLSEDSSHLVKENALLNQQVLELTKQIERVSTPVKIKFKVFGRIFCGRF